MTLKIDPAGRIVMPKAVRDRFGLKAGSELEVTETAEGVVLKPISKQPSLKRVGHFLVHTGKVPAGFDIPAAISDDREEQIRREDGL